MSLSHIVLGLIIGLVVIILARIYRLLLALRKDLHAQHEDDTAILRKLCDLDHTVVPASADQNPGINSQGEHLARVVQLLETIAETQRAQFDRASAASALPHLWTDTDSKLQDHLIRWFSKARTKGEDEWDLGIDETLRETSDGREWHWLARAMPFRDAANYRSIGGSPVQFVDDVIKQSREFLQEAVRQNALSEFEVRFELFRIWSNLDEEKKDARAVGAIVSEALDRLKKKHLRT